MAEQTPVPTIRGTTVNEEVFLARLRSGIRMLIDVVEVDPDRLGGIPVLKGTRFSVAQVLAELAEGRSVQEVADDFDLNHEHVSNLLVGLGTILDRSFTRWPLTSSIET